MKIEIDNIYTFKLNTGDEIVAKVVDESDDFLYLSKPLTVIPTSQGIQMIGSLFTGNMEKTVRLNKMTVSLVGETVSEVYEGYIGTTTGIKPVTSKILHG